VTAKTYPAYHDALDERPKVQPVVPKPSTDDERPKVQPVVPKPSTDDERPKVPKKRDFRNEVP
jgi:hypothetical protein